MTIAPIILFVYNRPEHTKKTVESLAKNNLAKKSTLYIFSDAAKNQVAIEEVKEVRNYIKSLKNLNYFDLVVIEEALENKGLANSIIGGVSKIMKKHDEVIILEDDLLLSCDFLNFMNEALTFYKNDNNIGSISGYSPLEKLPKYYKDDIWIASRTSSLGWGTWKDRWREVKWEIDDFDRFKKDKKARKKFDECGSDRYDRLRRQMEVGANSWSIRFGYWQTKTNMNTIFSSLTRVQHIGWDGSGVHGIYSGALDTHIKDYPVEFKLKKVETDKNIIHSLKSIYSGSLSSRFARYLRNNGFEKVESILRIIFQR